MNFIERCFGLAPDGGSGIFEVVLLAAAFAALAAFLRWSARTH